MSTITVYSRPSCVQCTATYRALDQNDLDYEIVGLSSDDAAVEIVKALGYLQAPRSRHSRPALVKFPPRQNCHHYPPRNRTMTEDISPELAKKTLDLTNSILAMIAAEQQRPLTVGTPALQGHCKVHPGTLFHLRATKAGAQEDLASHMNQPGSHHFTLEEIPDWHLGLPDDVIALMTAPPDTQLKLPRSRSIVENLFVAEPANPESTPTESEAN